MTLWPFGKHRCKGGKVDFMMKKLIASVLSFVLVLGLAAKRVLLYLIFVMAFSFAAGFAVNLIV